jgi:WD40 repeat protein
MEGHSSEVRALAVSRDGQIIASGDKNGEMIAWHGENGESLTQPIKAHSRQIYSVDFSPDGTVLATGLHDGMMQFWCTKTWQMQGDPIDCSAAYCIRYSPSGELLAIATYQNIQIYNPGTSSAAVVRFGFFLVRTRTEP